MPPAIEHAALVMFVQLAFKAIEYVIHLGETGVFQGMAGFFGTVTAAANQNHRTIMRSGHAHLSDEVRVQGPIDAVVPGNEDSARRMTDE